MNLPQSKYEINHHQPPHDATITDNSNFLPKPSAVSSVRGSEFITYLLPKTCTNWSKNLHSCFSPLETEYQSSLWQQWIKWHESCSEYVDVSHERTKQDLLSALEEVSEIGPQPLYPGLTLFRRALVALAGHDLGDLDEDVFVLGAALQVRLDLLAPPYFQEGLCLTVAPGQLRAVSCPWCT